MENEILEERIAQLERENRKLNRRIKLGGISILALLASVVTMGQTNTEKVQDVVRARRFEVVNMGTSSFCQRSYGKVMGSFGFSDGEHCGMYFSMLEDDDGEHVKTLMEPGRLYLGGFPNGGSKGFQDVSFVDLVGDEECGGLISIKDKDRRIIWHAP